MKNQTIIRVLLSICVGYTLGSLGMKIASAEKYCYDPYGTAVQPKQ